MIPGVGMTVPAVTTLVALGTAVYIGATIRVEVGVGVTTAFPVGVGLGSPLQ